MVRPSTTSHVLSATICLNTVVISNSERWPDSAQRLFEFFFLFCLTTGRGLVKYLLQPTGKPKAERPKGPKPKADPKANRKGRTKAPRGCGFGTEDSVEDDPDDSQGSEGLPDTACYIVTVLQEPGVVWEVSPNGPQSGSARTWAVRWRADSPMVRHERPARVPTEQIKGLGEFHPQTCRRDVTNGAIRSKRITGGDAAGSPSASAGRRPVRQPPPDSGPACQHPSGEGW